MTAMHISESLHHLIDPDAEFEQLADGFVFLSLIHI